MLATKFHTHTEQRAILYFYIYLDLSVIYIDTQNIIILYTFLAIVTETQFSIISFILSGSYTLLILFRGWG